MSKTNYAVIVYEGNYPYGEGSSCTLLGVYLSKKAAGFISETHKKRYNLSYYPTIIETTAPADTPEAKNVEYNLKMAEKRKNEKKQYKKFSEDL